MVEMKKKFYEMEIVEMRESSEISNSIGGKWITENPTSFYFQIGIVYKL